MSMSQLNIPISLQESVEATKVSYTKLGKCGLQISVPILGTMSIGHKDWNSWVIDDETEVEKLLLGAYERGLNTWDTAGVYSGGVSEEMIGRIIKKNSIPRHKVVLLTKVFGMVGEEPGVVHIRHFDAMSKSKDYVNQAGLGRQAIFNNVDASLRRLQTSYIDLLQIHRFDPDVPVEETMKALHDLVECGKVRYIGASSMWAYQFAKMQYTAELKGWTKFVSMQNHYSLCYREEEREMIRFCHETGVGLIPWSPLYRGYLARPFGSVQTVRSKVHPMSNITKADLEIIKRVEELAKKRNWTMSQVALSWIIHKGTTPIVGISDISRLDDAVAVRGKELSDKEVQYLEAPYVPKEVVGHS